MKRKKKSGKGAKKWKRKKKAKKNARKISKTKICKA